MLTGTGTTRRWSRRRPSVPVDALVRILAGVLTGGTPVGRSRAGSMPACGSSSRSGGMAGLFFRRPRSARPTARCRVRRAGPARLRCIQRAPPRGRSSSASPSRESTRAKGFARRRNRTSDLYTLPIPDTALCRSSASPSERSRGGGCRWRPLVESNPARGFGAESGRAPRRGPTRWPCGSRRRAR